MESQRHGRTARRWIGIAIVLGAVAVVVGLALLWWPSSDDAKARLEAVLSDALNRPVHIEALHVEAMRGAVELRGVTVENPPGFGEPYLLVAGRVDFDVGLRELLARRVVGTATIRDVELAVVRGADGTNLEGLGRRPDRDPSGGEAVALDLSVRVLDGRVRLLDRVAEQSMTLEGIDIEAELSAEDENKHGWIAVSMERASVGPIEVANMKLEGRSAADAVRIESLRADVGKTGVLTGHGVVDLARRNDNEGALVPWSFQLSLQGASLTYDVLAVVGPLYPPLLTVVQDEQGRAEIGGSVSATVSLAGQGLHRETVQRTLSGRASLSLQDVELATETLAVQLAAVAGRPAEPWLLEALDVEATLEDGWVELQDVELVHQDIRMPVTGRVHVSGALDLRVDIIPLMRAFGKEAPEVGGRYVSSLPIHIEGTVDEPELGAPTVSEVGRGLLGGALRRALQ